MLNIKQKNEAVEENNYGRKRGGGKPLIIIVLFINPHQTTTSKLYSFYAFV